MARILSAFPSALIAAREGMSANAFYREMQSLGIGARRQETLALYRIAVSLTARSPDEPFRDITQAPTWGEVQTWPTKNATGIRQTVALTYRERSTGAISQTWYSVSSDTPLVREEVMARAIDAYSEHADRYNQDLIGAIHTSTYRLAPVAESNLP